MKRLAFTAFAGLIAVGAAITPLSSMAYDNVSVFIGTAPPAPLVERIPAPRHGYVWAPGHWEWNGRRHIWTRGVWIAERPGYVYTAPTWYRGDRGWTMRPAGWAPYGRDRDRDGVPDRFERPRDGGYYTDRGRAGQGYKHGGRVDEDHDGVPNRYDHDRDGDGVPNRRDDRPDNPNRR
jgi:hypothetical protein